MIESFIKIILYVFAGLVLTTVLMWYVSSAYEALTGSSDLVIVPFTIADNADGKTGGRSEALARMLHVRLQQIEHDLSSSQRALMEASGPEKSIGPARENLPEQVVTSVAPQLFATQGVSLKTQLLEPTQVKIAVGGVDVGTLLPWFQRLWITQRTLEFTYYETATAVIVSGSLQAMGLAEGLRIEIPKKDQKSGANLDEVALMVATEIERRRLARDPTNRVEVLNTREFGDLIASLNEAAKLNRQAALGRPARTQFADLLARIESLASDVHDWHRLQLFVANIAESAGKADRAVVHYEAARDALKAEISGANAIKQAALKQQVTTLQTKIDALRPTAAALTAKPEEDALAQINAEVKRATDAFNKLFKTDLTPLPVKLLRPHDPNAYTDGKEFSAPPEVAQLPEITWHNVAWLYINKYLPVFSGSESEFQSVAYSYSDVLPVFIRQIGLIGSDDPKSWDLYRGGVAWIKAAVQKRDFKLGDDRRPLRSLANPGTAYDDPVIGKDPQIAHYKDFTAKTEMHAGAGIGSKAFYEAAQRVNVARAGEIWIAALSCLSKSDPVTYKSWAKCIIENAGNERDKIDQALSVVGLGSSAS
jgi:hypothetical protein